MLPISITCRRCTNDDDYAKASLFMLQNKRELHPSFTTIDIITLLYNYLTAGSLVRVMDANEQDIGVAAYYLGTPEQDFEDKQQVVFVDNVIIARSYRSSRVFVRGFRYLISQIIVDNPEAQEFRFVALSENTYLQKLYPKFASFIGSREGTTGPEDIYSVEINKLRAFLDRFARV
jgi:hypothetical protein